LLDFTEINISEHKRGEHYINMVADLNEYDSQCSVSSPSGLKCNTAFSTRLSVSGDKAEDARFRQGTVL